MEGFGKKLTEARNARGLEFDQVSRDTNITRRYLEALEAEDFTVFPGEPYLLGFLRNYCEYLGLNSNEFISAYKNLKIQETPIPLKDLIPQRSFFDILLSNKAITKVFGFVLAIGLLVLIVLGGYALFEKLVNTENTSVIQPVIETKEFRVTEVEFKERLHAGDSVIIPYNSELYTLKVIATAPSLKLETPLGTRVVELGQDLLIDLSGDDLPDVKVFVADLFRNDPTKGADVHISAGTLLRKDLLSATSAVEIAAAQDVVVAESTKSQPDALQTVLFEGGSAYPVTMNATFRGYCLFRFESDRANREERYYQKSELLTVQAKNGFRIWASNGNAVKLQMVAGGKTVDLELSRPGEVMVRDLKWIKDDETGRFKFVVLEVD
ncbi:MAG TPA: helix-turn-helix domain-containing protein [Treponemataceae bacterium]|nr:helix-turn-helix domain-containing protein [Treponemataceae bacterium]